MTSAAAHGDEGMAHVVPLRLLVGVFAALLCLTVGTVVVARMDFGSFNFTVAMAIATVKALLVVTYFMHLRWDGGFARVALFVGMAFVFLFLSLTLMDTAAYSDSIVWDEKVLKTTKSP